MSKPSSPPITADLRAAYDRMRAMQGHQGWWPGETPFEVCVGAILTQNTAWTNVEKAIQRLKAADVLQPQRMYDIGETELADLIRPAGYFNIKARRLRAFLKVLIEEHQGDLKRLFQGDTGEVRLRLLAINGIGPETADSMLLYAGGHASFVIDAYTKRIFGRHGWWRSPHRKRGGKHNSGEEYHSLQQLCSGALGHRPARRRLDYWQDYHAQLVVIGKDFCRPREARCERCPLKSLLPGNGACVNPASFP
ncbi:MAG TPA: hypothetical protein VK968_07085 [Roseimicrobium sp.]|nr:hypothetical protein [Roseimicrobium sp.]